MKIKIAGPYVEERYRYLLPSYYRPLIMTDACIAVSRTVSIWAKDGGNVWSVSDAYGWKNFSSRNAAKQHIDEWLIRIGVKIVPQEEFDMYLVLL